MLRHAVAYRPDFTILAGDGIYPVKEWSTSTTESAEPPSATSDFYRNLYASEQRSAVYGGGDWLPMLLRQSATFAIWDDHDIYPDIAGASGHPRVVNDETTIPYNDTGYDGLPQSEDLIPPQSAAAFFRVGTSVFLESFGIQSASTLALQDPLPSSIYIPTARRRRLNLQRQPSVALPVLRNDERRLFRKISLPDADLFLLDTRQYRDVPIPGEPGVLIPVLPKGVGKNFTCEGKYASPQFCLLLRGPHGGGDNVWRGAAQRGRTMLGDVQFQWLKNGLRKSDKNKVKIIVSTVFFFQAFLSPEESWQGYWGERQRLLKFIERNGIEKVVFLSSGVLGTIITRLNPFVGDERLAVHEITIGAGGRYTGGALLGPAVPIFENFVRLFSENGHLLPEEKRPNKFIAIDKSNFVKVRVEKGGRMIAECVGDDGEVIVDRAGKVCRLTVG